MKKHYVYKNLAWLNELPRKEASAVFLDCCGSHEWSQRMTSARPFRTLDRLYQTAEHIWFSLTVADHLEAFAAHPKIGEKKSATTQKKRATDWSAGEQGDIDTATQETKAQLAEVNGLYERKFGFIFIVCASGKSADEMLAVAKARLGNSVETELELAAIEQSKITEIRLTKLLER